MKNPWEVITEIRATDSKNAKQAILAREATAENDVLFRGIRAALDPMITFGVKKVPEKVAQRKGEAPSKGLKPEAFFELTRKLAARELTGDAAQVAIAHAMHSALETEWNNWYRLVLIKDLKAGFSESTVNKVCEKDFPRYAIPVFEVQLAKDCAGDDSLLVGWKLIDCKLDGMRCLSIIYPNGTVEQYSRNGKELVNFGVVKQQLAKNSKFFTEPMVLDGEIMSASFQDLMKQARRKTNVQANDSVLNLFDMITLKELQAGISHVKQKDRSAALRQWFGMFEDQMPNVTVIGQELVNLDTDVGVARLLELNAIAIEIDPATGKPRYEGIMIKDPEAPYECKRSMNWMKLKPFIEESLTVVGVEEGKADSKFVGTMGALVCEDMVDGKLVRVNVGGGYSIKLRAQIWANFTGKPVTWKKKEKTGWVTMTEMPDGSPVIGRIAEVRADALTKSEGSDTWSMRFPRFKTWRGFAVGEKL